MPDPFILSSSAGSGLLPRSAGQRGGLVSRPAALTHSRPVPAARLQARRQIVVSRSLPGLRAEEIKLSKASIFHVLQMTEDGCTCPTTDVSNSTIDQAP